MKDSEFQINLDIDYKKICKVHFSELEEMPLYIITCENGELLYNAKTGMRTPLYDSIFCKDNITGYYKNYLVYEENKKFGILSPEGDIIVKAKFNFYEVPNNRRHIEEYGQAFFQEIFQGHKYSFYIYDSKFYGKIPIDKYETCIRMEYGLNSYYIIKVGGKYGLLNHLREEIDLPLFDDIFFAFDSIFYFHNKRHLSETFLIGLRDGKYSLYSIKSLYDSQEATLIISECDYIEIIEDENFLQTHYYHYPYAHFRKNGIEGYVNEDGIVISPETFDEIKQIEASGVTYYLVYKDRKIGLLNSKKKILLPCIYDDIQHITYRTALVTENGIEKEVEYDNMKRFQDDDYSDMPEESHHYSEYAGSYAQDVMGYSDEDIDTIFDGDPDAYWNID